MSVNILIKILIVCELLMAIDRVMHGDNAVVICEEYDSVGQ